jgi:hypothetical protein
MYFQFNYRIDELTKFKIEVEAGRTPPIISKHTDQIAVLQRDQQAGFDDAKTQFNSIQQQLSEATRMTTLIYNMLLTKESPHDGGHR